MFVTVLWAQVTYLPEIVTEPKRGPFFEVEAFLPDLGMVGDLELDVLP